MALGRMVGSNRFSEDRQGLFSNGDASPPSVRASEFMENAVERGVWGTESVCRRDDLLDCDGL